MDRAQRSWREIAEELITQPTHTPAQSERFRELTEELLSALPVRKPSDGYFGWQKSA